jgi:hypothetical protein
MNPRPGKVFYAKQGDSEYRIVHGEGNYSVVHGPTEVTAGTFASSESPFPGDQAVTLVDQISDGGTLRITAGPSKDTPNAPFSFLLTHPSSPCSNQTLLQDLKVGFGMTITTDADKASTHFQCFKPTDTAPPFRATSKGIRTIPEENLASVRVGAANFTDTSSVRFTGNEVTSITVSEIKVIGAYGDNSPGITASVSTTEQRMEDSPDYTPGGIIQLDATNPAITYDQRLLIDYINVGGTTSLPYSILASSTHTSVSP